MDSWVRKIGWRRDRLPIPVFLGFPCSSAGKEFACNAGDPSSYSRFRKIHWRRDRLPTPGFLGFSCGSAGKDSVCNAGHIGLDSWVGKIPWRRLPTPVFWPGEFRGLYSLWGRKESDTTEQLSLFTFTIFLLFLYMKHISSHPLSYSTSGK